MAAATAATKPSATPAIATPAASTRLNREAAGRAVDSLLRWLAAQAKHRKAQLLEHDEPLRLLISLKRIPTHGRTNPYLISLPHPVHALSGPDAAAVCLIADDRPSAPSPPSAAEARIRAEGIPVSEVITLSGLRADYKPYEARRKLCGSYDVFLADRRMLPLLPRLLGKQFFKKKKQPLPVDLSRKGWPEQLRRCLGSASLYLRTGTCCQLDVGRASQGREMIVDNVIAAVEGAMAYIPKKWGNIRSIHLKSDESVALPIYQALPEMGFKIDTGFRKKAVEEVNGEAVQGRKRKKKEQEKNELGSEKGQRKKGRIREVRYMDTDLDDLGLMTGLVSEDGSSAEEGEDELDGEEMMKDSKKRKKIAKMVETGAQGSDEGAEVNGAKKKGVKNKKSVGNGTKSNLNDVDSMSGLLRGDGVGGEEGEGELYGEKKKEIAKKRKKDAKGPKATGQGSDEGAEVNGAKKKGVKNKKSVGNGTKSNLNDVDSLSGLLRGDGVGGEEGEGELYGEKKKEIAKKRKKDAKGPKATGQGSDEGAEVNGAKKIKSKDKKSDDKGTKAKNNKHKSKVRHGF